MVVVLGIGSSNQAPAWLKAELRGVWALPDLAGIWLDARRQHNFVLIFLSPRPLIADGLRQTPRAMEIRKTVALEGELLTADFTLLRAASQQGIRNKTAPKCWTARRSVADFLHDSFSTGLACSGPSLHGRLMPRRHLELLPEHRYASMF